VTPRTAARRAEAARLRAGGATLAQIAAALQLFSVHAARYYLAPPRKPAPPRLVLRRWNGTLPADLHEALRQRAQAQGVTVNSLIVAAVRRLLDPS
jgi:predicted HicB family RNase H-like nuclease